jgi:ClpX C4-type zinc finger
MKYLGIKKDPRPAMIEKQHALADPSDRFCSFCEMTEAEVGSLIEGPGMEGASPVFICAACVDLCSSMLEQERQKTHTGAYLLPLVKECFRGETGSVIERKARSAVEAADLGWVALVSGPLCGLFYGAIVLPVALALKQAREVAPLPYGTRLLLLIAVSSIAGLIVAGAFWTTSAILGKAREWGKKAGPSGDPDLDVPL